MSRVFSITEDLDLDAIADEIAHQEDKYSGGGRTRKKAHRLPDSRTLNKVGEQNAENAQINRKFDAAAVLQRFLDAQPAFNVGKALSGKETEDAFLADYVPWVNACLVSDDVVIPTRSIAKGKPSKSGGPGGQNVNKSNTQLHLKFSPANINLRAAGRRELRRSQKIIEDNLEKHLEEHIALWRELLQASEADQYYELTPDIVSRILLADMKELKKDKNLAELLGKKPHVLGEEKEEVHSIN